MHPLRNCFHWVDFAKTLGFYDLSLVTWKELSHLDVQSEKYCQQVVRLMTLVYLTVGFAALMEHSRNQVQLKGHDL